MTPRRFRLLEERERSLRARIDELEERVRQLEAELKPAGVPAPLAWGLTALEADLFRFLWKRKVVAKQSIWFALYGHEPDDAPDIKIVDVLLCKIRKKIKGSGIVIRTVWGAGVALELPKPHAVAA